MTIHRTIIAAAFALTVAGAAQADGLRPVEGRSIDLGDVSGIAYYTVEPDGFRVVATVAQGEAGTPVRLETVLAPDQSVVLSTPREGSVEPNAAKRCCNSGPLKPERRWRMAFKSSTLSVLRVAPSAMAGRTAR